MTFRPLTALVVVLSSCGTPDVTMALRAPQDVLDNAKWFEVGAYENCPTASQLAGGLPEGGAMARIGFAKAVPQPLGVIPGGTYGFAAVARDATCGVLAAGCVLQDVAYGRSVEVDLAPTSDPKPTQCAFGAVCEAGRCVPPTSLTDPSVGTGCSMQLMGAGPLGNTLPGGPLIFAPAIAAVADGFFVGYFEYVPTDGTSRLVRMKVDNGGAAYPVLADTVDGHCPDLKDADATALSFGSAAGVSVISRPPCDTKSGLEVFTLGADAKVGTRNLILAPAPPGPLVQLSPHAVVPMGTGYLIAERVDGQSQLLPYPTTPAIKVGPGNDKAIEQVVTAKLLALLAIGPFVSTPDGGAPPPGDHARVHLLAPAQPPSVGAPYDQFPATKGAIAARDARVYVVTDSTIKGHEVAYRFYESGKPAPMIDDGFAVTMKLPLAALDAAPSATRLFIAFEHDDILSVAVIDGANGPTPTQVRRIDFPDDGRIPTTYHDGPVAVAATDTRVIVAWGSRKRPLDFNEAAGGYAVFACK